jgi:DNA-binding GntR family transcriptional regulator
MRKEKQGHPPLLLVSTPCRQIFRKIWRAECDRTVKLERPHALSLTEHTARTLRKAILRGDLKPGARVVEQAVAEKLGISRGPVREAIQQLASEGLLVIHPRRGAEVRTLDRQTAWEVLTLRATLEAFAVELAHPRLQSSNLEFLQGVVGKIEWCCRNSDLATLVETDLEFHGYIVSLAGHARLSTTYHTLDPLLGAICFTAVQEFDISLGDVPRRHQRIVDALASGDVHHAVAVVKEHYQLHADNFQLAELKG